MRDSELCFEFYRSDGEMVPLCPGGEHVPFSFATRAAWCDGVERLRRNECARQVAAVRRGLGQLVPLETLALWTAEEFERLVCGDADWSVAALKASTDYEIAREDVRCGWLWEALEGFSKEERALFLQFVWGRSRMPQMAGSPGAADNGRLAHRFKLSEDHGGSGRDANPNERLPVAHTCFFQLHLPRYTEKDALRERLRYAIYNGRAIDLDHVNRDATAWREEAAAEDA